MDNPKHGLGEALDDNAHVSGVLNLWTIFWTNIHYSDEHVVTSKECSRRDRQPSRDQRCTRTSVRKLQYIQSLVKIVAMQLQQSFAFLSWLWQWPDLLVDLKGVNGLMAAV